MLYIYIIYTTCILTSLYLFAITECISHRLQSLGRKVWYNTIPFLPAGEVPQSCLPALHNISTCEKKDKQCQPEDDNNENVGKLKDHQTSESNFQAVQDTYTVTAYTKQTPKKYRTRPPWLAWKRMPSGHCGQLAAARPGPRKMVPFWTFLEAVWSTLKHFETVRNSRSRNSLKQSEADWSQAQYYMAQLRSLTTEGLHFSLLGINLLNLSHRHSRNHTFELLRGQKQDLQMTNKGMLTTSCNSPLSKSWGQMNLNEESSNQI